MDAGGSLKASSVESMHARENIEFLTEQCFEALLALMTRINLNTSILDHSQLILELLCIGCIAIHEGF